MNAPVIGTRYTSCFLEGFDGRKSGLLIRQAGERLASVKSDDGTVSIRVLMTVANSKCENGNVPEFYYS